MILTIVSWFLIGSPVAFGVVYTFGNVVTLLSSMFLCGPKKQFANMTDKTRIGTTSVYLLFMALTLYFAFRRGSKSEKCHPHCHSIIGVMVCGTLQSFALIWYSLSYIPFARQSAPRAAHRMPAGTR